MPQPLSSLLSSSTDFRAALRSREEALSEQEDEHYEPEDDSHRMGRLRPGPDCLLPALFRLLRRVHGWIVQESRAAEAADAQNLRNYRDSAGRRPGVIHGAIPILGHSGRRI